MRPLYKTTIVTWSETAIPGTASLQDMAWEADQGADYCSKVSEVLIDLPEHDPDWDGTEFFDREDDDEE